MKKLTLLCALLAVGALVGSASADTLFYYGRGGINEGHTQLQGIYTANDCGGTWVEQSSGNLPADLSPYGLIFISTPGWQDPNNFFTQGEKDQLIAWMQSGNHRLVLIGEWDGFYGQGQQVLIDLVNSIGVGGMAFIPGVYDSGCGQCNGTVTNDPLTQGLNHVCKAATAIWDEGGGTTVAFPVEAPNDPFIISNGTNVPCLVGIGDSNVLSDSCGHLGDADTAEFALRLCNVTCAGVPVEEASWGQIKATYK